MKGNPVSRSRSGTAGSCYATTSFARDFRCRQPVQVECLRISACSQLECRGSAQAALRLRLSKSQTGTLGNLPDCLSDNKKLTALIFGGGPL